MDSTREERLAEILQLWNRLEEANPRGRDGFRDHAYLADRAGLQSLAAVYQVLEIFRTTPPKSPEEATEHLFYILRRARDEAEVRLKRMFPHAKGKRFVGDPRLEIPPQILPGADVVLMDPDVVL